uniref:Uncharacterized protein n=1 Tax=Setaria italica TaxID=4555 RepID=K3Z1I7_SETIT
MLSLLGQFLTCETSRTSFCYFSIFTVDLHSYCYQAESYITSPKS